MSHYRRKSVPQNNLAKVIHWLGTDQNNLPWLFLAVIFVLTLYWSYTESRDTPILEATSVSPKDAEPVLKWAAPEYFEPDRAIAMMSQYLDCIRDSLDHAVKTEKDPIVREKLYSAHKIQSDCGGHPIFNCYICFSKQCQ